MKKKFLNIILIVVISIVVLYFALRGNYKETLALLFKADLRWLFLGYMLVLSYNFLKSIVTNNIINKYRKYTMHKAFDLQLMLFFFNAVTPFSTGGQPLELYILKKNGLSLSDGTNVVVQTSILHQLALFIVGIIAIVINNIFNIVEIDKILFYFLIIGFLINTLILILLFVLSYWKKFDKVLINFIVKFLVKLHIVKDEKKVINRFHNSIDNFNIGSKLLISDKLRFMNLLLINVVALICLYIVPLIILFSLGFYFNFNAIDSIVLIAFVSIISCFVPLPGGTGSQEYLFLLFFGYFVKKPILGSLMILWRFITYYLPMIVGAIIFNLKKEKI